MDTGLRDKFMGLWSGFFPDTGLPITFEITDTPRDIPHAPVPEGWRCLVCDLDKVRRGASLFFDETAVSCSGGKIYAGFEKTRSPEFRYFLSYGKEGVVHGERYKKTPEMVDETVSRMTSLPSQGKGLLFRRWDNLCADDDPEVVIFFAQPEVLSGLFTLANYDRVDPDGVICPFGSGCSSIIHYPWLEQQKESPRAVLGMFDPSARKCVAPDILTFAVPMKKFARMVTDMGESFLTTETWETVKKKIRQSNALHAR
jgi:uncharacterized protein (DUF169 family)